MIVIPTILQRFTCIKSISILKVGIPAAVI